MADTDKDSKTELPTDKKLNDAFDEGRFAKSQELQVVAGLAAGFGVFGFFLSSATRDITSLAGGIWSDLAGRPLRADVVPVQITEAAKVCAGVLLPVIVAVVIAAVLMGGFQSGFRMSPKAVGFKPERLDVVAGFKRVFDKGALVRSGIDVLKLVTIALVLWIGTRTLVNDPIFISPVEAGYLGDFIRRATMAFLSKVILGLGIVAAVSYSYEKFKTQRDLMMSRQEIKDEHKQAEGDVQAKAAMRRMARRLMQKQMLAAVPTADVIVTNPTHYAVALKYERGRDQAPVLLAKGENQFARRIKALGAQHQVPTVENVPVARMLYALGKVGDAIPADLYQAVAGILALVYRTHRLYFHELKMRRAVAEATARRAG
ncbi:MAG: EscU/YscU/HrcU family type III secretion system export apparatus switch protein [Verrucomicrobiota bacterium]